MTFCMFTDDMTLSISVYYCLYSGLSNLEYGQSISKSHGSLLNAILVENLLQNHLMLYSNNKSSGYGQHYNQEQNQYVEKFSLILELFILVLTLITNKSYFVVVEVQL